MQEQNKDQRSSTDNQQGNNQSQGRLHGSGNESIESGAAEGDISEVDQQEGNMNNGVLGGNFEEAINGEEDK